MASSPEALGDVVAVVLARGLGRRMREEAGSASALSAEQAEVASTGQKGLIPIAAGGRAGRPFLDYLLSDIADAGISSVALVIGPEHDALRRQYSGEHAPTRVGVSFVIQQEPLGTANAILAAESFAAGRPFLSLNSDNLYPVASMRALAALDGPGLAAFERQDLIESSGIPSDRIASFSLIDVDDTGRLRDIREKPGPAAVEAAGPHALVSMNEWRFDARIFDACRDVPRSARGEFELPEAVRLAVRRGVPFHVVRAKGPVLDLSRREDVPNVTRHLADRDVRL
jgi:glucose-1-phosphate thymidylyltransferase